MLELILRESKSSLRHIIFYGILSGLASSVMLGVLNHATTLVKHGEVNLQGFLLFITALILTSYTKVITLYRSQTIVEGILRETRLRITKGIRKSNLISFETIGKETYYVALTQHTSYISDSSISLINAMQSTIIVGACIIYIGILSIPSVIFTVTIVGIAIFVYLAKAKIAAKGLKKASKKEKAFFALLEHILKGFKELSLSKQKSQEVLREFNTVSDESEAIKISISGKIIEIMMFSQAVMYLLVAGILIILPALQLTSYEILPELIIAILFLWGPLDTIVGAIPHFSKAKVAVEELDKLELELQDKEDLPSTKSKTSRTDGGVFQKNFSLQDFTFNHFDASHSQVFTIGELNLKVNKGELIFITGGNGCGKTTLFKSITSLYPASSGEILLNDITVEREDLRAYRENFSAVYADFHLFPELYGVKKHNAKEVNALLEKLELRDKTTYDGKGFSSISLSLGQRKRLGIIAALLEHRPICMLDEPAAELDPAFRRYFYEELLPEFRAEGRTFIIITHDDRYFSCCDRLIKMESGLIVSEERQ